MSELEWPQLLTGFAFGMFVATAILDLLYRWWRREADALISAQRDWIATLEAEIKAFFEMPAEQAKTTTKSEG